MQKTALITWEFGAGLGHLACLNTLSMTLLAEGYRVHVAVKDISRAHLFFSEDSPVVVHQAPVWLPKIKMQRPVGSLADLLLTKGYLEPETLNTLVRSWRTLFDLIKPDLLVCNYSPTAMLASTGYSLARLVVGTGFSEPVAGQPLKPWRPGEEQQALITSQEQALFKLVQAAVPPTKSLERFSDIYHCLKTFIYSPPALDGYADIRTNAIYALLPEDNSLPKVEWPESNRPNILLYLKYTYSPMEAVLSELSRLTANVMLVCPGRQIGHLRQKYPSITFIHQLVDMAYAMTTADLFIGHGALGTTSHALMTGVPVIALPIQLENELIGRQMEAYGVGLMPSGGTEPFSALVDRMLKDQELAQRCTDFKNRQSKLMERDFNASFTAALRSL